MEYGNVVIPNFEERIMALALAAKTSDSVVEHHIKYPHPLDKVVNPAHRLAICEHLAPRCDPFRVYFLFESYRWVKNFYEEFKFDHLKLPARDFTLEQWVEYTGSPEGWEPQ